MEIDRRSLLAGAAATFALRPLNARAGQADRFAAVCKTNGDAFSAAVFGPAGDGLVMTPLPARGHDIALRPNSREAIVFARRPGRFAVAFDTEGRAPPREIASEPDRHFFGHGIYATDGRLLFSTENDIAKGRGVLGIRDATGGYKSLGLFETGGIGPHDIALLSDGSTLVVANGGIDTDPNGRDAVNITEMRPSLVYLDIKNGDLIERVELNEPLRQLSIRHLAVGAADTVVIGCQWEGEKTSYPPLVGLSGRGRRNVELLTAPDAVLRRMKNYVGSIAVDASGEIAVATAPKGSLAVYWSVTSGAFLGTTELADVCGVAGGAAPREILLTGGAGDLHMERIGQSGGGATLLDATSQLHWDNHVIRVSA